MGKNTKKLLTIDSQYTMKEYDVHNQIELEEKENCVVVGNVYYPFDFFVGIQLCNEEQYRMIRESCV